MPKPFRLVGAEAIEDLLKQLPPNVARNVTNQSLRAGAGVIANAARANIRANGSIDSGLLLKRIAVETQRRPNQGQAEVIVGVKGGTAIVVRKGKTKPMRATPRRYAHLVEFGTEHSAAEPFMRPAVDGSGSKALAKVVEAAASGLARVTAKLKR